MTEKSFKEVIMETMKAEGLEFCEESAKLGAKMLFKVIPAILLATKNKNDDLVIPLFSILEPKAMELLDLINKEDNVE
jgi:hypothetical protein